ncbi:uncharacterized protein LOC135806009 [Sycon ciliatum]|uniref:uncharacterized protein LOC135806009 n=1 Tax=Sycon ciliatum TaxID=27933 RepID=UPI0031F7182E|eukprot:scpid56299/ scgid12910/ Probable U3 small nucleolar RNA-associated protein 7; U three protein 7
MESVKPKPKTKEKKRKPAVEKYLRGSKPESKGLYDKKLRARIQADEKLNQEVAKRDAWRELLMPEEAGFVEAEGGLEKTYKFQQKDITTAVDVASARKHFNLSLEDFGPYQLDYSRDGRHLLLGGRKGHVALMDWQSHKLECEFHLNETLRCLRFLHVHNMFAVAQKENVYIYDNEGTEMHRLQQHKHVTSMEFLPYHFLLATGSTDGHLRYMDTSIGKLVADHNVRLGRLSCMTQNPHSAVIHLGHQNGVVSLWTPNSGKPQVQMLCHRGAVGDVAIDRSGTYMVTSGVDCLLKVWDLRTYKQLHFYRTPQPARSISISQRGLLAAGCNTDVRIWRDGLSSKASSTYLQHHFTGLHINEAQFCPYEDVIGIGHSGGFSSLLVPGAGEANFDALEHNPFQTKRQKQEKEVKQLLEKLPPDLITLDTTAVHQIAKADTEDLDELHERDHFKPRHRTKGKSSAANRFRRIQAVRDRERRDRIRKSSKK